MARLCSSSRVRRIRHALLVASLLALLYYSLADPASLPSARRAAVGAARAPAARGAAAAAAAAAATFVRLPRQGYAAHACAGPSRAHITT